MIHDLAAAALLVIDAQEEYFDPTGPTFVAEAAGKLPAINQLVDGFHQTERPVVLIRHAHRADGSDVGRMADFLPEDEEDSFIDGTARVAFHGGLHRVRTDLVVSKVRYDSFESTDLDLVLRGAGVDTVVVAGFMTSFCCTSTVRSAHDRDYGVVFVPDAVGGPDLERPDGSAYPANQVLEDTACMLAAGFAEIATAADVLARLGVSSAIDAPTA